MKWPEKDKPYFDLKPTVIPDFFTDEQYKGLYDLIKSNADVVKQLNEPMGYFAQNIYVGEPLFSHMVNKINEHYKLESVTENCMFVYNRYTWKTGFPPTLKPHFDTVAAVGTITLSIILDTSDDWDIYVEDELFSPKTNQALLFSGTHHLHWRPKKEFKPDDHYEFFLCHFIDNNPVQLDDKYWEQMVYNRAEKSTEWWRQYESDQVQ